MKVQPPDMGPTLAQPVIGTQVNPEQLIALMNMYGGLPMEAVKEGLSDL